MRLAKETMCVCVWADNGAAAETKKSSLSNWMFLFILSLSPSTISNMPGAELPENVELLRTRVVLERDRVFSVSNLST